MIRVLITEPFTLPTPLNAACLDRDAELAPALATAGIEITTDPDRADLEIRSGADVGRMDRQILERRRVVVVDGEPPQPAYLLPYYRMKGFADVLCPANLRAYSSDGLAYLQRPEHPPPEPAFRPKILQLTTFRSCPAPRVMGLVNGRDLFDWRVLCTWRCRVGLHLKLLRPDLVTLCGSGWPEGVAVENSRAGRWAQRKLELCSSHAFNLCWENMEIPHYVTEKLWEPIVAGSLPLYWGPPEMHAKIPADTVIDCRAYEKAPGVFDTAGLLSDLEGLEEAEWRRRIRTLRDWLWSFPKDARRRSLRATARNLAEDLRRAAELLAIADAT